MFKFWFSPMVEAGNAAGGGTGTSTPAAPATSQGTSAPAASTPAPGSQSSASPTGTQQPATQQPATTTPQDDLQDGNWKELRTRYETQKAELATLKAQASPQAAAVITHAQGLAKNLGYTDADFAEAFAADPVKTLQILAQEQAEAQQQGQQQGQQQQPDLKKQIEDAVAQRLTPIQEFQNRQTTEVAMTKYNTHLDTTIAADPILKDAPVEVVDMIKDYLGEYFSTQPEILLAMKTKHDFTAVNDTLKFVAGRMHGAFKAWLAKSQPGTGSVQQPAARTGGKFSLDDIIEDPGVLGNQYKA